MRVTIDQPRALNRRALLPIAATAALLCLFAAPLAQARPPRENVARDGHCDPGEFCLYYNSNHRGSISDFRRSIPNYGATQPRCYEFRGAGAGKGLCVKNEAAAVWNRRSGPVTVFYNSYYKGRSEVIPPGAKVNLTAVYNENASHRFERASVPEKPRRQYEEFRFDGTTDFNGSIWWSDRFQAGKGRMWLRVRCEGIGNYTFSLLRDTGRRFPAARRMWVYDYYCDRNEVTLHLGDKDLDPGEYYFHLFAHRRETRVWGYLAHARP